MIPANVLLTKVDRLWIKNTRDDPTRRISRVERRVILQSLEAYRYSGREDREMIHASISDILGRYNLHEEVNKD